MILSLEEDEEDNLHDADQNIMTLDGELMMSNGRVLPTNPRMVTATSERNLCAAAAGNEPDKASVCSCTCYGRSSRHAGQQQQQLDRVGDAAAAGGGVGGGNGGRASLRVLWCVGKMFGCRESVTHLDEENFYDAETQSISNYARFAVKRASF